MTDQQSLQLANAALKKAQDKLPQIIFEAICLQGFNPTTDSLSVIVELMDLPTSLKDAVKQYYRDHGTEIRVRD